MASREDAHAAPDETPPTDTAIAGERAIASVNRARSLQSRVSNLLALLLMSSLGLGLLGWYYARTFSRQAQVKAAAQGSVRAKAQGEMPLPPLGQIEPPTATAQQESALLDRVLGPKPELSPSSRGPARTQAATSAVASNTAPHKSPLQTDLERRLAGAVFVESVTSSARERARPSVSDGVEANAAAMAARSEARSMSVSENSRGTDERVEQFLTPSATAAVRARVLPTERLLLPKGAFIDCTLETAIDTSLPGFTTCMTATDTFGADGTIVLLERGTKLFGETRGQVRQGSARVFVLWTEARTPAGVVVPLASPGTDELGRAGLPGTVDRHFFDRFGAAILISVIDGAIQAAQSNNQGGTVIYNPSSSQDILTEVLQETLDIPPTVIKQNGDRIQVLVARDLDFRSVYELRVVDAAR